MSTIIPLKEINMIEVTPRELPGDIRKGIQKYGSSQDIGVVDLLKMVMMEI